MKKQTAIFMFIVLFKAAYALAAVDLSIGGTAWYVWWNPAWSDAKSITMVYIENPGLFIEDSRDFKPSPNAMAGPVISIGFLGRWSIQSVFAMGQFKAHSRGFSRTQFLSGVSGNGGLSASYKKYSRDILKWDSDTSIGCAVHRMVKIFGGFKAQGYRYEERLDDVLPGSTPVIIGRFLVDEVKAFGGGIGVGLTFPLGADFYLMMSASGLALWSTEKVRINRARSFLYENSVFSLLPVRPEKGRYFSYGGSASLSLAYNISRINTTLSLGGRYQLLYNMQRFNKNRINGYFNNDVSMNIIDKEYDHFFGILVSAIYTFHIGNGNE
ncbi:MAG: hypothetical protein KA369_09820 [Spirochaetes bacterium]|nr:hypothetical protein [Spirochaetota bacterium]